MGYTASFEPAMLPANARQAHMEMGDTPMLDKGAYVMLGSDDYFLRQLAARGLPAHQGLRRLDHAAAQAIAVKVVNPGGISAFKFNQRKLDLDEKHVHYHVTPREIILTLARALQELGVPHPLHIHGCNLGMAGNIETTLATIRAAEGLPLHLTHIQFHSYGTEGEEVLLGRARLAELVNKTPEHLDRRRPDHVRPDVTASGDTMRQYAISKSAHPKWVVMDIECDAGCGVVPFRYRDKSYVNALQWAIGLETFLLFDDPWRIFLTTDHPNGAPFTTYPHLIRLLMDKSFRRDMMPKIRPDAQPIFDCCPARPATTLLYEIAIIPAPARPQPRPQGHRPPRPGAPPTSPSTEDDPDREAMFTTPVFVFKNGELVVKNGKIIKVVKGATHVAQTRIRQGDREAAKEYFSATSRYGWKISSSMTKRSSGRQGRHRRPATAARAA